MSEHPIHDAVESDSKGFIPTPGNEGEGNVQPQQAPKLEDSPAQVVPLEDTPDEHEHGDYDTDTEAGEPDFEAEEDES